MADDGSSDAVAKSNEDTAAGGDVSGETKDLTSDTKPDADLDDLLNSALEDFDKQPSATAAAPAASTTPGTAAGDAAAKGSGTTAAEDPVLDQLTEEFSDELAAQFEEAMRSFMTQDPAIAEQMQRLSAAASNAGDSEQAQQEFASALGQTLNSMCQNAQNLQEELTDEDIARAFGGLGGEAGEGVDFMPAMQGLMKTLLSKEVLYPSLREISDKYPPWLEANKASTEPEQFAKYEKQLELMQKICTEFESENPSDSQQVKTQRFEAVMEHMQQMQELGQPPKDIIGEMAPGLEFDENGMPRLPGMGAQCCVM